MAKLNERWKRFCDEYLIDLNATQAYLRAGYKVKPTIAAVNAKRLLGKRPIQEYIQKRQQALHEKTEITQERVLAELVGIGFSDIIDFVEIKKETSETNAREYLMIDMKPTAGVPRERRGAIAGIKQGRNGIEIKLHDKLRALDQISRIMGYVKDGENEHAAESGVQIIDDL